MKKFMTLYTIQLKPNHWERQKTYPDSRRLHEVKSSKRDGRRRRPASTSWTAARGPVPARSSAGSGAPHRKRFAGRSRTRVVPCRFRVRCHAAARSDRIGVKTAALPTGIGRGRRRRAVSSGPRLARRSPDGDPSPLARPARQQCAWRGGRACRSGSASGWGRGHRHGCALRRTGTYVRRGAILILRAGGGGVGRRRGARQQRWGSHRARPACTSARRS